jgi:hypothetical protein
MSDMPPPSSGPDDHHGPYPGASGTGPAGATATKPEPLWVRALYMLLFAVIMNVLVAIFLCACLLQVIVIAVSEKPNAELTEFLRALLAYIGVTLAYLAFLDDHKPFPFAPFPRSVQG